jgi:hypothetical protein
MNTQRIFAMAVITASLLTGCASEPVNHSPRPGEVHVRLGGQSVADALTEWSVQTGVQIVVGELPGLEERIPFLIMGSFTPIEALDRVLAGRPFRYEVLNPRSVAILAAKPVSPGS